MKIYMFLGLAFATTEYICHESASIKNESNGVKNYLPEEPVCWEACQQMNNVGPNLKEHKIIINMKQFLPFPIRICLV